MLFHLVVLLVMPVLQWLLSFFYIRFLLPLFLSGSSPWEWGSLCHDVTVIICLYLHLSAQQLQLQQASSFIHAHYCLRWSWVAKYFQILLLSVSEVHEASTQCQGQPHQHSFVISWHTFQACILTNISICSGRQFVFHTSCIYWHFSGFDIHNHNSA